MGGGRGMVSEREIPPPSNHTVDFERKAVLYAPDGRALVRPPGFITSADMAMQTTGTFPQLTTKGLPKPTKTGGNKREYRMGRQRSNTSYIPSGGPTPRMTLTQWLARSVPPRGWRRLAADLVRLEVAGW